MPTHNKGFFPRSESEVDDSEELRLLRAAVDLFQADHLKAEKVLDIADDLGYTVDPFREELSEAYRKVESKVINKFAELMCSEVEDIK